jgi:serine protease
VVDSDPDGTGPLSGGLERLQGSLVIDFADGTTVDQLRAFNRDLGLSAQYHSVHSMDSCLTVAEVPEEAMGAALTEIAQRPEVTSVSPNYIYSACSFPNDPEYKYQWHMKAIGMEQSWTWTTGRGVTVAIIDTGIAYLDFQDRFRQVEDLAGTAFTDGYDFINRRVEAVDDHAHGTHVAGTVAQSTDNGTGVTGIAFGSTLMPIKVLGGNGSGTLAGVADGIRFAADHGASVMNLSLGSPSKAQPLDDAVAYAVGKGCVVVCAAGNSSTARPGYPAGCEGAISVSALDFEENLTWYSNHGPSITIAAPGGDTRQDKNGDGMVDGVYQNTIVPGDPATSVYLNFQGTSMAAPHVAGVFALGASLGVTDRAALEKLILENTRPAPDGAKEGYGAGILDASLVAHAAGYAHGCSKLLFGFAAGALAFAVLLRRRRMLGIAGMVAGVMLGATGILFAVPALGLNSAPLNPYLTTGFPAWDLLCFGTAAHGSPFTHSLLAPLFLAALSLAFRGLRPLAAGFAAGVGGHLMFVWQFQTLRMEWLSPGLQSLWLMANALLCVALATALATSGRD